MGLGDYRNTGREIGGTSSTNNNTTTDNYGGGGRDSGQASNPTNEPDNFASGRNAEGGRNENSFSSINRAPELNSPRVREAVRELRDDADRNITTEQRIAAEDQLAELSVVTEPSQRESPHEWLSEYATDMPVNFIQSTGIEAMDKVIGPWLDGYTKNPLVKGGMMVLDNALVGNYVYEPLNEIAVDQYARLGLVPVDATVTGGPYRLALPEELTEDENSFPFTFGEEFESAAESEAATITISPKWADYILDMPTSLGSSALGTSIGGMVGVGASAMTGNPVVGFFAGSAAFAATANATFEPIDEGVISTYDFFSVPHEQWRAEGIRYEVPGTFNPSSVEDVERYRESLSLEERQLFDDNRELLEIQTQQAFESYLDDLSRLSRPGVGEPTDNSSSVPLSGLMSGNPGEIEDYLDDLDDVGEDPQLLSEASGSNLTEALGQWFQAGWSAAKSVAVSLADTALYTYEGVAESTQDWFQQFQPTTQSSDSSTVGDSDEEVIFASYRVAKGGEDSPRWFETGEEDFPPKTFGHICEIPTWLDESGLASLLYSEGVGLRDICNLREEDWVNDGVIDFDEILAYLESTDQLGRLAATTQISSDVQVDDVTSDSLETSGVSHAGGELRFGSSRTEVSAENESLANQDSMAWLEDVFPGFDFSGSSGKVDAMGTNLVPQTRPAGEIAVKATVNSLEELEDLMA